MIMQETGGKLKEIFLKREFIIIEFVLLCLLVPGYIMFNKLAPMMFLFLWSAAIYSFAVLYFLYEPNIKRMWKWSAVTWPAMKPILIRFVLACIGMTIFIYFYDPERMFGLFDRAPQIIPFLLVAYPVLSALPQELIFCTFFFARYAPLFGTGKSMIIASTIIFAYAHLLYINPVAPTLSLLAGWIFATTYYQSKSLALVTIEHGLYGNYLFLVGLGYYFHGGSVN